MADYNQNSMGGRAAITEVNTNSIALFAPDSTMLRIAFKGDAMFFTIIPRVADPNGGRPRWPKEMGRTASFRAQQASALYQGFMKKLLPDIEQKIDHPGYCVIPLNRDASNLCGFSYAGGQACFTIFNGVSADRTCSDSYSFVCDTTPAIDKYNPNTGTYEVVEIQSQLYVIIEALHCFSLHAANPVGHNVKNAAAWSNDMMQSYLRAIATRLGATPGQYGQYRGADGYNGGYNGGASYGGFGGGSSNPPFVPAASDAYAGQPALNVPTGGNENVTWSTGFAEQANVGANAVPQQIEQVSSLDSLMG
jgi:hypothetical protein